MIRSEEVRITSASGGQKGKKLARFSLLPPAAMEEVANVYGRGAEKYADRNWEKGYDWTLSLDALKRHLNLFEAGEQRDELGNHHLACVVFHALALITFEKFGLGTDDRSPLGRQTGSAPPDLRQPEVPRSGESGDSVLLDGGSFLEDTLLSPERITSLYPQGDNSVGRGGLGIQVRKS